MRIFYVATMVVFSFCAFGLATASADDCNASIKKGLSHFANFHLGAGEFQSGVNSYLEAAKSPECAYEAYWRLADLYLCRGASLSGKKDKLEHFETGVQYANKAIKTDASKKEGHFYYCVNTGSIVEIDGVMKNILKVRGLKKANDKALAIDPNYAPALVVDGRFDIDLPGIFGGSNEEGEAKLKKAIQLEPNYETPYVELAAYYIKSKRYDEAEALLNKLMSPDFKHQYAAPWIAVEKLKAEKLMKQLKAEKAGN